MTKQDTTHKIGRRPFLAGAAAATATFIKPSLVRGTQANATVDLGIIGCGGRGGWIADLFSASGKYRFVACADYFQDRVDAVGNKQGVDAARRYTTLSGYKRLLDDKLDAVVIETPPYFHPQHAAAAVDAGKHVFVAKPIAVDVPGCASIAQSGKKATAKKLVFLVDFQTRANPLFREAAKRVHAGDIGRLVAVEAHYPWAGGGAGVELKTPEEKLRVWYQTLELCGDVIVEQDIHALDVATWFIGADPIKARGTAGRAIRVHGTIRDHFAVSYWFPNDLVLSFTSVKAIPGVKDEIRCKAFGAEGVVDSDYFGDVRIRGKKPYEGGNTGNLYKDGPVTNLEEFYQFITRGDYSNPTVVPSVRSNMTSVLGRNAADRDGTVTWDEIVKANVKLEPDLSGLKS